MFINVSNYWSEKKNVNKLKRVENFNTLKMDTLDNFNKVMV